MKFKIAFVLAFTLFATNLLSGQGENLPVSKQNSTVFNREVLFADGVVYLNEKENDGILWLNNTSFKNGTIEVDLKGRNVQGKSFVGFVFHAQDEQTFDAIYFRPFNFKSKERGQNSVQYISMPQFGWETLRESFPRKYEKAVNPIPNPVDDWFHAKIVVNYPQVKVYVNGSEMPSLEVDQLSTTKHGKVGFWVGNGSDGWFKNLKITKADR